MYIYNEKESLLYKKERRYWLLGNKYTDLYFIYIKHVTFLWKEGSERNDSGRTFLRDELILALLNF